jgi:FkbM family methyltransferase
MKLVGILQPEYLWRPRQIFERIRYRERDGVLAFPLPGGFTIQARSTETIGRCIATQGVYDLPVSETIFRLSEPGDISLDVGANIGYMSLILAQKVGPAGLVVSFEPNPVLHGLIERNLQVWAKSSLAPIRLEKCALSFRDGQATLAIPAGFDANQGIASLDAAGSDVTHSDVTHLDATGTEFTVAVRRLDCFGFDRIGVMKIDVEGHEAHVFEGARQLLERHAIRDIVFEEQDVFPAASHNILAKCGYRIFRLSRSMFGPLLLTPESPPRHRNQPSNFLATVDPVRARKRLAKRRWDVLGT